MHSINAALSEMRHLGSVCAHLANTVQLMLARHRVHLFNRDEYAGAAGLAPIGMGSGSWMLLLREVLSLPELQQVLAHEADHIDGEAHLDSAGNSTPHSATCGARAQVETAAGSGGRLPSPLPVEILPNARDGQPN